MLGRQKGMMDIGTPSRSLFMDISYLKSGNAKQKAAYEALNELKLFQILDAFSPVLTGTVPIDIDIEGSDLDIICEVREPESFEKILTDAFGSLEHFQIHRSTVEDSIAVVCNFQFAAWPVEIFGQDRPVTKQNAYRHMVIEHRILERMGGAFLEDVRALKQSGLKTEPAFARLLQLEGDPYRSLLEMFDCDDGELRCFLQQKIRS